MRGKLIPLSLPRRFVIDLLYFSAAVPTIPVQRLMKLGPLVEARRAAVPRVPWSAIFVKGFALVAQEFPELRRAYLGFPTPRIYEYPQSVAVLTVERDYQGEPSVFSVRLKDPAGTPLIEVARIIRHCQTAPLEEVKDFRRMLAFARLPRLLRRLLMWIGLNIGRQRANFFGTFALSVFSALGAESLRPQSIWTAFFNYGVFASDGSVYVRLIYDHRVLDGSTVARALARFEQILTGVVLEELQSLHGSSRAA